MRLRGTRAAPGDRATPHQEGSLKQVAFVGSFPRADFTVQPDRPEIAFLGRSNVGKSSLINAIVGRKALARTSKTPGKTRDCVVYAVDDRFYLIDLPGYGYARVSKSERARLTGLIEAYLTGRTALAGVVWLLDIRRDLSAEDARIGELLQGAGRPVLIALTKGDKYGRERQAQRANAIARHLGVERDQVLVTSSRTRLGIPDLRDSLNALIEA